MITVSFIIPVYNCRVYLPECVGSIREAGISDYEILLIDDGSTDGSAELCDELACLDSRIHVIHQKNSGVSSARNRGIREAKGEYILFADADDTVDAALAKVIMDPRCDRSDLTIFGMTFDYYRKGRCYRRDSMYFEGDEYLTREEWGANYAALFEKNSLSPLWNKVFKRSILEKFDLKLNEDMFLYEDFEFTLRYMRHCDLVWNVPQAIYHYRQAEDEGNARRRLVRIDSIPTFLEPIEQAITQLAQENAAIGMEQKDRILHGLYMVLAREKIACSDVAQIKKICLEYQQWALTHTLPMQASEFQNRLTRNRAVLLWIANKKTMLRHGIAVWVKANVFLFRNRTQA